MKTFFSFLALTALGALALSAVLAVGAWFLMILIGSLHHAWWATIPTISYAGALQIEMVLVVGGFLVGVAWEFIKSVAS